MREDEAPYFIGDDDGRIEKRLLRPAAVWRLLPWLSTAHQQHARQLILDNPVLRAALWRVAASQNNSGGNSGG